MSDCTIPEAVHLSSIQPQTIQLQEKQNIWSIFCEDEKSCFSCRVGTTFERHLLLSQVSFLIFALFFYSHAYLSITTLLFQSEATLPVILRACAALMEQRLPRLLPPQMITPIVTIASLDLTVMLTLPHRFHPGLCNYNFNSFDRQLTLS